MGIRASRQTNAALIAKLGWRVLNKDAVPWSRALRAKYLSSSDFWTADMKRSNSALWNNILKSREVIRKGIRWKIGFNSSLDFWNDAWVDSFPLCDHFPPNARPLLPQMQVRDAISSYGG